MQARPYEPADLAHLNRWYAARGAPDITADGLPSIMFVVDDVGAGGMYVADGKLAILEYWVSNPAAQAWERHDAFEAIGAALMKHGIKIGVSRAWVISAEPDIVDRAKAWEFKPVGTYEVLARAV